MKLKLFPTLRVQRRLFSMPRNLERFWKYTAALSGGADDVAVPIVSMNPMGREHNLVKVDELLAMEAESVADAALAEVERRLPDVPLTVHVSLVVVDNLGGMWSNRTEGEYKLRVPADKGKAPYKRRFIEIPCWVNEVWTAESLRSHILLILYRYAYWASVKRPTTLVEVMRQEGLAMMFAETVTLTLSPDDVDYSRLVLTPYHEATEQSILMPALLGDSAAREFGYQPLGLSPRAGLEVALADALQNDDSPEAAVLGQLMQGVRPDGT